VNYRGQGSGLNECGFLIAELNESKCSLIVRIVYYNVSKESKKGVGVKI